MWKTILGREDHSATSSSNEWFAVEAIAGIAVTSEADDAPVENVLYPDRETGWRAGEPGRQIVRVTFGRPTNLRHIQLTFRESQLTRTQEFTLSCTVAGGERREVIHQQWTFSPQGSTEEVEITVWRWTTPSSWNSQSILTSATTACTLHCFVCASARARLQNGANYGSYTGRHRYQSTCGL